MNYVQHWESINRTTADLAVSLLWEQWRAAGAPVRGTAGPSHVDIIDPEVLLLSSLAFTSEEPRLNEQVVWWASQASTFVSVSRMKTLARRINMLDQAREFAVLASSFGDHRWKKLLPAQAERDAEQSTASGKPMDFLSKHLLMPKIRSAFGLGVKADLFSVMVGYAGKGATVSELSRESAYTKVAVRKALQEMARSGMVQELSGRPAQYRINSSEWIKLFQPSKPSRNSEVSWFLWWAIFGFFWEIYILSGQAVLPDANLHTIGSATRDILIKYEILIEDMYGTLPSASEYPGHHIVNAIPRVLESFREQLFLFVSG